MTIEAPTADTFEADLQAMIDGKSETAAPAAGAAAATLGSQPAPAASPAPAAEPPTEEVDPRIKALDEIDTGEKPGETKPAAAPEPKISEADQAALAEVPVLRQIGEQYKAVIGVLESHDFAGFEGMLDAWKPSVKEGFIEYFYQTYINKKDSPLLERFIAEQEGRGPQHTALTGIQKEVRELKAQLQQEKATKQQAQQQTAQQQTFKAYNDTVTELVEKYAPEGDRKFILNTIHTTVAQNPKIQAEISSGDLKQARIVAKDVMKEYFTRDKATKSAEAEKIATQEQKKPLIGGAAGGSIEGALPENIRDVPKGQEDTWLNAQLGKLKAKLGK